MGMSLSERIREAVRADKRTEPRVAEDAGIARSTLHRFMHGRGAYSDILDALAKTLDLELRPKGEGTKKRTTKKRSKKGGAG
jgi:transcriptional regulator with XRE-family HTH domain